MKNLQDFQAEKVEIKSIYGGLRNANTFSCNTMTIGGSVPAGTAKDDGSDEADDQ